MTPLLDPDQRLEKELTLLDVFAVATGAMISSGFFLLPGLAAARAGPSVVLAYAVAGLLVIPPLLSKAELSTAMPRAGGTYYFLDRSLGPLVGTVGGFGTWASLVFKSAFALLGFSAYLALFLDVPITPVALALTAGFMLLNIVGAKETTGLQRILVAALLSVVAFFLVQGFVEIFGVRDPQEVWDRQFTPFLPFGFDGLVGTVGFVFVSYTGLTKVASVAEEVENPDRNIPLGMILSLLVVSSIYVLGVAVMVAVLDPVELRSDLTPVATAGEAFFDWLPGDLGVLLVVVAAFAAFASTANAGILSASRYPLAMARDDLLPGVLSKLGRFGTPVVSVLATSAAIAAILVAFDPEGVAKLASTFKLLIFAMLNLSVIVMRESRLPSYLPGFRSPLYPWMQVAGFVLPFWLIVEMGVVPLLFTLGVIGGSSAWYVVYARDRVNRRGAVLHVFERLGRRRYEGLEPELRQILKEKTMDGSPPFERAMAGAVVVDLPGAASFREVAEEAARRLAASVSVSPDRLLQGFMEETRLGVTPVSHGAALPHLRVASATEPHLVMVRVVDGVPIPEEFADAERAVLPGPPNGAGGDTSLYAFFFLVSPRAATRAHLHILAHLAGQIDREGFLDAWRAAEDEGQLRRAVLHEDRLVTLRIAGDGPTAGLVGRTLVDADRDLPDDTLVVLIERDGTALVPRGPTEIRRGDRLTLLGDPDAIDEVRRRFG